MSAGAESDDVKSVVLEVVDRPPSRNPWRPTTLTIRKFLKVCHWVEKGFAVSRACDIECVTYRHFRRRVANSIRLQERLREAEATRFNLRHEQALESIMAAGERSWMAHAWWLERCLPHLYALRNVNRADPSEEQLQEQIPSEILAKHRQFYAELLLEDRAKSQSRPAGDSVEQINQISGKQIGQF